MPYTPDATDYSQPTDSQKASSMGLEFRTLKEYIQTTLVPSLTGSVHTSGVNTMAAGSEIRFPGGNPKEGIIAVDYTTFVYDTSRVIPNYGLTWKTLDPAHGLPGAIAVLSGYGGIYLSTTGAIHAVLTSDGNFNVSGNITATGGQFIGNASSSTITAQRRFGNIRTDGIDRGSYGVISVAGIIGGYSGIDFTDAVVTLMISHTTQGILKDDTTWWWNFDNGVLTTGQVPWARIPDRPTALSQFTNDIGAGGGSGVSSFNGRGGAVTQLSSDITGALGFTPYSNTNPSGFTTLAAVSAAGYQTSAGSVNSASTANSVTGTGSNGYGNRTVSTSGPSGGADGDIWYQV